MGPFEATLKEGQRAALAAVRAWVKDRDNDEPFFVLSGSAGTGKTYLLPPLADDLRGRIIFTAPTNKTTKVLRQRLTREDYKPECATIYSLLGLRLEPSGEVRELSKPDDDLDLSDYRLVVIDEGSMVNSTLMGYVHQAVEQHPSLKFLFLGDKAQLPPVKEASSPCWRLTGPAAELAEQVRFGGPILALAERLRECVGLPMPRLRLESDNADGEGIWACSKAEFADRVFAMTRDAQDFLRPEHTKVIAWRNVTVDNWNRIIRAHLFDNPEVQWLPEDRVIFTAPAKDLENNTIATTDDEGTIAAAVKDWHPVHGDVPIWRLTIRIDEGRTVVARVLHPEGNATYSERVDQLARDAKAAPRKWKLFWEFKEAFHSVRHAYAITAHRSQGSTYDTAFVDWRDVLLNQNTKEAYQCLYVAASRPRRRLILG